MTTAIHRFVEAARAGRNPRVVRRMESGWLVMAEKQVLRGYCLLLPDRVVPHLNTLPAKDRACFLRDMALAGDAILQVTGAARINYELLGNLEPALHAHIIPRFVDEPEHVRTKPIWFLDWNAAADFDAARDAGLVVSIGAALDRLIGSRRG